MMDKKNQYYSARRNTMISNIIFDVIIYIVLAFVVVVTVYPFWNTIAISLNDGLDSLTGGIKLLPRKFTWKNYANLFTTPRIFQAGIISVTRTILQTIFSVFCTTMLAYALSRKEFVMRKSLTTILVISMYVNAGLIPGYMLIKNLHLLGKYAVYIVPALVDVFNFILVRTYINGLPDSFVESARIDGANEFRTFNTIVMPLMKPALATQAIFQFVAQWNNLFTPTILITSDSKKTLPMFVQLLTSDQFRVDYGVVYMGLFVTVIPLIIAYCIFARFIVAGVTLGGVKG